MTSYHPQVSRDLAAAAEATHESKAELQAARDEFERYHSAARMLQLSSEVEFLRAVVEQARRIRYSPEVGYVEVRHLFEAMREQRGDAVQEMR
jgi:hypothetical protein